jgi:hypothetical protein
MSEKGIQLFDSLPKVTSKKGSRKSTRFQLHFSWQPNRAYFNPKRPYPAWIDRKVDRTAEPTPIGSTQLLLLR